MFKNYCMLTQENVQKTVAKMGLGYQMVILSIQISGSTQSSGLLYLSKYNEIDQLQFKQIINVDAKEPIVFDHKILLPQGWSYKISSNISGIGVCLNAVLQTSYDSIPTTFQKTTSSNSDSSTSTI